MCGHWYQPKPKLLRCQDSDRSAWDRAVGLASQTRLFTPYFNSYLVDLRSYILTLDWHLSPHKQYSFVMIFLDTKMLCWGLTVSQELILRRIHSTMIANLNAELIHSLLMGIFGQKKEECVFQQAQIVFDLICVRLLQKKNGFDGIASLSGV